MTQDIRIETVGLITAGEDVGRFVLIQDARERSGGYLILIAADEQFQRDGGDYWVETEDDIREFFVQSGWTVSWKDDAPSA